MYHQNVITKEELFKKMDEAKEANSLFFAIRVTQPGTNHLETLVNYRGVIELKRDWYDTTYNNDLISRRNPNIQLVAFAHGDDFAEIQKQFRIA